MYSPLLATREEGCDRLDVPRDDVREMVAEVAGHLQPRDYLILGKVFEGKKAKAIAGEMGLSPATVRAAINAPAFQTLVSRVEEQMLDRISRGEFGALAIAKAETVGAMQRIVGISRAAEDERVKLNANLEILKLGGIQPPKPQVLETPERIVDLMTAEELEQFAKTGTFPERLGDQVARLTSAVVKAAEAKRFQAEVVDGVLEDPPELAILSSRRERRRRVVEELPPDEVPEDVEEGA